MSRVFSIRYDVTTSNSKEEPGVGQYDGRVIIVDLNSGDATSINVHEDDEHNESFDAVSNVVTGTQGDGLLNKVQLDVYEAVRNIVQECCVDPGPFVITITDQGFVLPTRLAGPAVEGVRLTRA